MDSYNNEPQHIVVMKALNMYEEMQRNPEKPEEPVRLSPDIERAGVDLEKIKGQLESFDQLVSAIGDNTNPDEVSDLLSSYELKFDLEKELDL